MQGILWFGFIVTIARFVVVGKYRKRYPAEPTELLRTKRKASVAVEYLCPEYFTIQAGWDSHPARYDFASPLYLISAVLFHRLSKLSRKGNGGRKRKVVCGYVCENDLKGKFVEGVPIFPLGGGGLVFNSLITKTKKDIQLQTSTGK